MICTCNRADPIAANHDWPQRCPDCRTCRTCCESSWSVNENATQHVDGEGIFDEPPWDVLTEAEIEDLVAEAEESRRTCDGRAISRMIQQDRQRKNAIANKKVRRYGRP